MSLLFGAVHFYFADAILAFFKSVLVLLIATLSVVASVVQNKCARPRISPKVSECVSDAGCCWCGHRSTAGDWHSIELHFRKPNFQFQFVLSVAFCLHFESKANNKWYSHHQQQQQCKPLFSIWPFKGYKIHIQRPLLSHMWLKFKLYLNYYLWPVGVIVKLKINK